MTIIINLYLRVQVSKQNFKKLNKKLLLVLQFVDIVIFRKYSCSSFSFGLDFDTGEIFRPFSLPLSIRFLLVSVLVLFVTPGFLGFAAETKPMSLAPLWTPLSQPRPFTYALLISNRNTSLHICPSSTSLPASVAPGISCQPRIRVVVLQKMTHMLSHFSSTHLTCTHLPSDKAQMSGYCHSQDMIVS